MGCKLHYGLMILLLTLTITKALPAMEAACLEDCDVDSGPVCGIDASGLYQTFENLCYAVLEYCRFGRYYAVVRPGEC